jgi:hypothetical protein
VLIVHGYSATTAAPTTTTVFDIGGAIATAAYAGPTLPCNIGNGAVNFQLPNGKFMVICGNASNSTFIVDTGYALSGTYISEPFYSPSLTANTTLTWKNVGTGSLGVKVRTNNTMSDMQSQTWRDVTTDGSNIGATAGNAYAQVRFDFQATMPDQPGEKQRVWQGSDGGTSTVYYRQPNIPILQYWRLVNATDPNLLTMTSQGASVFRFAQNGQAYTAAGGAWNSGGADLAERYSSTQQLEAGEVVASDQFNPQNVQRSTTSYQSNLMGVVSTDPGFVAGAYTENSYPIALVGRVPVKVSNENGNIRIGDYLTSGSIPGYAMKATMGGRVIGQAIDSFDPATSITTDCPNEGNGNLTTTACGTVTVFVSTTTYNGEKVEMAMADSGFTGGLNEEDGLAKTDGYTSVMTDSQQKTLAYLEYLKATGQTNGSEIFADKIYATSEIIAPTIIADLITAKRIKADQIEGLDILVHRISMLEDQAPQEATGSALERLSQMVLAESTRSAGMPSNINNEGLTTIDQLYVNQATMSGNLRVKGSSLIEGILNVVDTITTQNLFVTGFTQFFGDTAFKGNVTFEKVPLFNSDTAGTVIILKGQDRVDVVFTNQYQAVPVITANLNIEQDKSENDADFADRQQQILAENYSFIVSNRTIKHFTIVLNKTANEDLTFSWVAISTKKTGGN